MVRGFRKFCCTSAALTALAVSASADFYLVDRVNLGADFGPLGNNPVCVTSDGTYAYIGGYYGGANPTGPIGILKLEIANPVNRVALTDAAQTVAQFRFYGGLALRNGILYAMTDRPDGSTLNTSIRALDATTGLLDPAFDGDGILLDPVGPRAATGGLGFDPGFMGSGDGLSMLAVGSGRRFQWALPNGFLIHDSSTGMIVTDTSGCAVDISSWRDHVWDADGNIYTRRSNQVMKSVRSGANAISSRVHITDALNLDGTPRLDCGDGRPVALRLQPNVLGQNVEYIPATSAGAEGQELVIFNDRFENPAGKPFANVIFITTAAGDLTSPTVQLLTGSGVALPTSIVPDGNAVYDFHYDAANDRLLVLDFFSRSLLVFSGTQPLLSACCLPNGSCTDTTPVECAAAGGTFQGGGFTCGNVVCPQPTGACCAADGSCTEVTAADCATASGTYQGDDSVCDPNPCPQPPTGACCNGLGVCVEVSNAICDGLGGVYQGDATVCDPNPCPPPSLPADSNCDGLVNFDDIDCFIASLIGQETWDACGHLPGCDYVGSNDVNGDDSVNFDDIDTFIQCLINGACP